MCNYPSPDGCSFVSNRRLIDEGSRTLGGGPGGLAWRAFHNEASYWSRGRRNHITSERGETMSSNYQRYPAMMQEVKRRRVANRPLRGQLEELLDVVRRCEASA
jgi:hypothetical protein